MQKDSLQVTEVPLCVAELGLERDGSTVGVVHARTSDIVGVARDSWRASLSGWIGICVAFNESERCALLVTVEVRELRSSNSVAIRSRFLSSITVLSMRALTSAIADGLPMTEQRTSSASTPDEKTILVSVSCSVLTHDSSEIFTIHVQMSRTNTTLCFHSVTVSSFILPS